MFERVYVCAGVCVCELCLSLPVDCYSWRCVWLYLWLTVCVVISVADGMCGYCIYLSDGECKYISRYLLGSVWRWQLRPWACANCATAEDRQVCEQRQPTNSRLSAVFPLAPSLFLILPLLFLPISFSLSWLILYISLLLLFILYWNSPPWTTAALRGPR